METVLDEDKEDVITKSFTIMQGARIERQTMEIALLKQEVRGLKAMLNQYKRDYKKLLEERT